MLWHKELGLPEISLVVEYNKPAVISPCLRVCRGVVYRSIRAGSPCLCVFREHCLCFLSMYSSLCPPSPTLTPFQLNHVTLWTQRVTSSSLLLMQSGTRVRHSLNYKYIGRVLSLGFLEIFIYHIYHVTMYLHLHYYSADFLPFLSCWENCFALNNIGYVVLMCSATEITSTQQNM